MAPRYDHQVFFAVNPIIHPMISPMIQLSPAAIAEVKRIQSQQPQALFRLGVEPGGCSQFYYTLGLSEAIAPEDQVMDCNGIQVVIAAQHQPYLQGVKLDYTQDLMGGGFRFDNPNSISSCGCGNSFATSGD
jgi:iron-sulfur cluster assembly protein